MSILNLSKKLQLKYASVIDRGPGKKKLFILKAPKTAGEREAALNLIIFAAKKLKATEEDIEQLISKAKNGAWKDGLDVLAIYMNLLGKYETRVEL